MITRGHKNWARLAAVGAAAAMVVGCGDDPVPVLPAGNVVQGPVQGATVFADRTDGGSAGVLDAEEKAFSAVTDATGRFSIPAAPTYPYELVSIGGTDTITNQAAITMRAEGGSAGSAVTTNVLTPLTTLVALAPAAQRDALRTTIRSLGVEPNARIDQGITPAAAALVKAVTTMVTQVTEVVRQASIAGNTGGLPARAEKAIQTELVRSIATNLAGATAASLDSAAEIATVTKNAASAALTALAADATKAGGVTITANAATVAAVAAAVETSTTSVVNAIQTASGGSLAATAASIKPENQIVVAAVTTSISAQTSAAAAATVQQTANIAAVAPANAAPTITGATSASGVVGTAFTYTPTIADANTDDLLTVKLSGSKALPPGLTLNPTTGVISGNPTASGEGVYTLTVSDGRATAAVTVTITITRVTGATGATF